MTDVMQDLLIDFDEMGFAPMTACPNPDKYACEWKGKLVAEINCLQEQLEAAANGQETLQKALAEKDRDVSVLNSDLKLLRNDYNYLKEKFDKAIKNNISLKETVLRLTAEKDQLIKTSGECQTEAARALVEKDKEIERLKNELRYLTNERDLFLVRHPCVDEATYNLADKMAGDTSER